MSHAAVIAMLVLYLAARVTNYLGIRASGGIVVATGFMSVITFKLISLTVSHGILLFLTPLIIVTTIEVVYFMMTSWFYSIYAGKYEDAVIDYYYRSISKYLIVIPILTAPMYIYGLLDGTF